MVSRHGRKDHHARALSPAEGRALCSINATVVLNCGVLNAATGPAKRDV